MNHRHTEWVPRKIKRTQIQIQKQLNTILNSWFKQSKTLDFKLCSICCFPFCSVLCYCFYAFFLRNSKNIFLLLLAVKNTYICIKAEVTYYKAVSSVLCFRNVLLFFKLNITKVRKLLDFTLIYLLTFSNHLHFCNLNKYFIYI